MALAVVVSASSCGTFTYDNVTSVTNTPKMTCTKPIDINGDLTFPCGKCMSCRVQRTQEWAIRLMDEAYAWESSVFVTLTYSEEKLPEQGLVSKRDLQLFLKRLRKSYPTPLKYYAVGEYGDQTFRPHYHLIIFGMSAADKHYIDKAWDLGLTHIGTVTIESCRYVASYVQKKLYNKPNERNSSLFQLSSRGLGLQWAIDNETYLRQQEKITHQGVPMGVPRYYVKKLGLDLSKTQAERERKVSEELTEKQNELNESESDIFTINLQSKVQKDRNITARTNLKQKKL